ncbi:MAG: electron transfer flavoprotein subunit beta/FixA family protein [Acidimicrobiales bacterium]
MNVLVCVKRVPLVGGRITLSADRQEVDTSFLGFTMSPHEECAVEEAVTLAASHGGTTAVLTLGPPEAVEQLRYAMSIGIDRGLLLQTSGAEVGPQATARAIAAAISAEAEADGGTYFDLVLFGNEAADTGDFQVGVRVAEALGRPCVTGVKGIEVQPAGPGLGAQPAGAGPGAGRPRLVARREQGRAVEVIEVDLPAVCSVKEGLNLPRYPSLPGRLRAKSKPVAESAVDQEEKEGMRKVRLELPGGEGRASQSLGTGAEAAPRVVQVLADLGLLGATR